MRLLVTGGTGFIGSALVRQLVKTGYAVRVLDNNSRGMVHRLHDVIDHIETIEADIRDATAVQQAIKGVDAVCHLAFINGTEYFYTKPDSVLDVGVKGIINVLDGCLAEGVGQLILASSSEVYQTPPNVPTDESVPLSIPDPLNPRYSYGGGKIISELMAINYGRKSFDRVLIFRPHNVYGPDMGWEHVIPQFVVRMKELCQQHPEPSVRFPIHGSGKETRAFAYIDDCIAGILCVIERGEGTNIYNIGTSDERTVEQVAKLVGGYFDKDVIIEPGEPDKGATLRRCPDITKLRRLGYLPAVPFEEGLQKTVDWYSQAIEERG